MARVPVVRHPWPRATSWLGDKTTTHARLMLNRYDSVPEHIDFRKGALGGLFTCSLSEYLTKVVNEYDSDQWFIGRGVWISDERGDRLRIVRHDRKRTMTNITRCYNNGDPDDAFQRTAQRTLQNMCQRNQPSYRVPEQTGCRCQQHCNGSLSIGKKLPGSMNLVFLSITLISEYDGKLGT
ncbi:hypothetical protein TNCV_2981311 [Trichonephila clavipes]|nr:hypothetical protein TNCV_2981311 [Trichonephila clavipes]